MDQATQDAIHAYYAKTVEKKVLNMTESELIQLVKRAVRECLNEDKVIVQ